MIDELNRLQRETRVLVRMVEHEVGKQWMTLELKLQIEKIEELLRITYAES